MSLELSFYIFCKIVVRLRDAVEVSKSGMALRGFNWLRRVTTSLIQTFFLHFVVITLDLLCLKCMIESMEVVLIEARIAERYYRHNLSCKFCHLYC